LDQKKSGVGIKFSCKGGVAVDREIYCSCRGGSLKKKKQGSRSSPLKKGVFLDNVMERGGKLTQLIVGGGGEERESRASGGPWGN